MTRFVGATAPSAVPPITGEFFPSIDVNDFRLAYRADSSYSDETVREALIMAFVNIADDLSVIVHSWQSAGYASLADVPAVQVDGQSILAVRHKTAVCCFAKAQLVDTFKDTDTTKGVGHDRANNHELSSDFWRREGRAAINQLLDKPTIEATLI